MYVFFLNLDPRKTCHGNELFCCGFDVLVTKLCFGELFGLMVVWHRWLIIADSSVCNVLYAL